MRIPTDRSQEVAVPLFARLRASRLAIGLTTALLLPGMAEAQTFATMAGLWSSGSSGDIHLATSSSTSAAEFDLPYGAGPVLEIEPLLEGERRVVEVPPGSLVLLDDPLFDPAVAIYVVSGNDLEVSTANGGVLVLEAFFDPADPSPMVSVLGGPVTSAAVLLARAESNQRARPDRLPNLQVASGVRQQAADGGERTAIAVETRTRALEVPVRRVSPTPGPDAAGGGELAAIVPIVAWLVSRLDIGGSAEAAELLEPPSVAAVPILDQVLAQLRIASAIERLRLVDGHLAALRIMERGAAGRGDDLDEARIEVAVLEARLNQEDARLERDLAIDDHLDRFKYRLTSVPFPQWPSDPPRGLADLGREVAETHYVEAARQFRHLGHARESLALVAELELLIRQVRDLTLEQFEVGLAELNALLAPEATLLAARLRAVELVHAQKRAEAWLLAVMGELTDDVVVRQRRE